MPSAVEPEPDSGRWTIAHFIFEHRKAGAMGVILAAIGWLGWMVDRAPVPVAIELSAWMEFAPTHPLWWALVFAAAFGLTLYGAIKEVRRRDGIWRRREKQLADESGERLSSRVAALKAEHEKAEALSTQKLAGIELHLAESEVRNRNREEKLRTLLATPSVRLDRFRAECDAIQAECYAKNFSSDWGAAIALARRAWFAVDKNMTANGAQRARFLLPDGGGIYLSRIISDESPRLSHHSEPMTLISSVGQWIEKVRDTSTVHEMRLDVALD